MEKNNDGSMLMQRRRALQVIGASLGAAGGLVVLGGCNKSGGESGGTSGGTAAPAPAAAATCQDKVPVDDAAKTLRKTLQYKEKSEFADKNCSLCAQFEAGKYGDCGGCKLFAGGVNPQGHCLSFAPKGAGTAPAAPGAPAAPAAPAKG